MMQVSVGYSLLSKDAESTHQLEINALNARPRECWLMGNALKCLITASRLTDYNSVFNASADINWSEINVFPPTSMTVHLAPSLLMTTVNPLESSTAKPPSTTTVTSAYQVEIH